MKWRVPSFPNWDALRFMLRGAKIADIAIIVNSIDPVRVLHGTLRMRARAAQQARE